MAKSTRLIDIDTIVEGKEGKKKSKLFLWLIKKIICQDKINQIILNAGDSSVGIDFAVKTLEQLEIKTTVAGIENIPKDGSFIFVSNHPLGALEALAIGKHLNSIFENKINFITNEILSYIKPLNNIFTSVNVGSNKQDRDKLKKIEELFNSDNQIIMFPSGVVSRKIDGIIQDPQWKKMFVTKSRQYQRDIIPIHCSGNCSKFFINLSYFRKKIGIKANIELLFLPREMLKYRGRTISITFGKPISCRYFDGSKTDYQYAQEIRKKVYSL